MQLHNPFILAPMAGITDMPFRRLMKRLGAGCVVSEFVSAHAVVHAKASKNRYLKFHEEETPFGFQLFGGDEKVLVEAAKRLEDLGVDFVDINMGCPVPKVTKKGGGSAWLCHPIELAKLLADLRAALSIPITIKIRLGWDANSINAHEIVNIASNEGIEWVAVHGRTRAQGYSGNADWNFIQDLANTHPIKIVGNGDLVSGALAAARLLRSGCSGVMIGRGALKNPWIFLEAVEALSVLQGLGIQEQKTAIDSIINRHDSWNIESLLKGEGSSLTKRLQPVPLNCSAEWARVRKDRDLLPVIELHLELLREVYPETKVQLCFRKFLAWYSAGYPGSHKFRKEIFTTKDFNVVIGQSLEFFDSVKSLGILQNSEAENDPSLMRGHG